MKLRATTKLIQYVNTSLKLDMPVNPGSSIIPSHLEHNLSALHQPPLVHISTLSELCKATVAITAALMIQLRNIFCTFLG